MNKIARLQFLQQNFRKVIRDIQNDIIQFKNIKRLADENGQQEIEYEAHTALKAARKELKKWVALQVDCKNNLKKEYEKDRCGKCFELQGEE